MRLLGVNFTRLVAFVVGSSLGAFSTALGEDISRLGEKPLELAVKVVDGHIVVPIDLFNAQGGEDSISAELNLDDPDTLTLESKEFGWLELDSTGIKKGKDVTVRVDFAGGVSVLLPGKGVKELSSDAQAADHEDTTKRFATELNDRKVYAELGAGFLKSYLATIDLSRGKLILAPRGDAGAVNETGADFVATFQTTPAGRVTLPVSVAGGPSYRLVLGSATYNTSVDPAFAKSLGKPAGDLSPVNVGGTGSLDLSQYVAFKTAKLDIGADGTPPKPPAVASGPEIVLVSGVDLLEVFRVQLDWSASHAVFFKGAAPQGLAVQRAFFKAQADNTAEAYQAFLEAYPKTRFNPEAAQHLVALRLDEFAASDGDIAKAFQWLVDTSPDERKMENCVPFLSRLSEEPGHTELAIQVGLMALKYSRTAFTNQETYRIHRILGEQYLAKGDLDSSWSHFLAAAFVQLDRGDGHPDGGQIFRIAFGLAQVYEKQGRVVRAYSRYRAALNTPDAPISKEQKQAINAALERLKKQIPEEQLKMLDS